MNDEYSLTRRDFIKASAVAFGITVYAAKTAGARGEEKRGSKFTLEAESATPESTSEKPIDSGYWELSLQVRSNAILDGLIN